MRGWASVVSLVAPDVARFVAGSGTHLDRVRCFHFLSVFLDFKGVSLQDLFFVLRILFVCGVRKISPVSLLLKTC